MNFFFGLEENQNTKNKRRTHNKKPLTRQNFNLSAIPKEEKSSTNIAASTGRKLAFRTAERAAIF